MPYSQRRCARPPSTMTRLPASQHMTRPRLKASLPQALVLKVNRPHHTSGPRKDGHLSCLAAMATPRLDDKHAPGAPYVVPAVIKQVTCASCCRDSQEGLSRGQIQGAACVAVLQRQKKGLVLGTLLLRVLSAAAGIELNTSAMETLLYLCSGGRSWDTQIANSSAPALPAAAAGESLPVTGTSHSAEQPLSEGSLERVSEAAQACGHQQPSANGSDPVGDSRSKQSTRKIDHSTSLSPEVRMLSLQPI